ncbi:hypothetical protein [Gordonia terrae]|uniref:Uncharacterized protein n=2 Tax=Gordonia terrae TaxID=2055 RepID=A0AAD0K5B5_9ACTN|nr:hypothetical protein [Gordonia terrae]VTR09603.1 Uncharacterised protein [Clostridioides difficile]ANY22214.1 hypothetical protein BCM27_04785 [Gordonia terrae]AWO82955.1 hypothetical protein DLJ61_04825 [Gordonia terrae]VTS29831.1 Uncharacterised protein [Gordonia terrae]GAB46318.1 hypothetical protein GOTRE_150_00600 [Gordonia terrae NBRC 100016]
MTGQTIYIVDRVVVNPGCAREFVEAYTRDYAPTARDRGMKLDRILLSPPVWFEDEANTVTATWTVDGQSQWWATAIKGRHDPAHAEWWTRVDHLIENRSRSMAAAVEDVEGLCNV